MGNGSAVAQRFLREPLTPRARREAGYLVFVAPLTVFGVLYAIASLALGAGLAITALGVPLISWAVPGARWFGSLRRRLTNHLVGTQIPPPAPFRPPKGFLPRVSAGLRDRVGWRVIGFLLLAVPLDAAGLLLLVWTWASGLIALTSPVQYALGVNFSDVGAGQRAYVAYGFAARSWGGILLVCVIGAAVLVVSPWAVRAFLLLDRFLVRNLLGGETSAAARIRDLERSRAYAIEDVAATLRRIERDLHDGVQARMVALAMSLTMLNETLGEDISPQSRNLLTAALGHAKDGIAELRVMVSGIHPPALDAGLETALATLAARSPIPVDVRAALPERPTEAIETIAYFSVAELLTNVTKHSGADRASIELAAVAGRLVLTVRDDGRGGAGLDGGGTGLRGLTERVGTVDGSLAVESPEGGPTVVTIELPMHVGG